MAYLRDKTRPQSDRSIVVNQDNFGGGLNVDVPATDIDKNEAIGLENYIAYDRYLEGRTGSVEIDDTEYAEIAQYQFKPFYHKKEKCLIFQGQFGDIYRWDGNGKTPFSVFGDKSFLLDATTLNNSVIKPYGDNALLLTGEGYLFMLYIKDGNASYFEFNSHQPLYGIANASYQQYNDDLSKPYKYKYVYTFSIQTDANTNNFATSGDRKTNNVIWESPPLLTPILKTRPYTFLSFDNPISATNPFSIYLTDGFVFGPGWSALDDYTGYFASFYRTLDLGQNGFDNEFNEQFVWLGDLYINSDNFTGSFTDNLTSEDLEARLTVGVNVLKNYGWSRLENLEPGKPLLEVTENFVFLSKENSKNLLYSQRTPSDSLAGFHNPAFQQKEYKDGITVLAPSTDFLSVICNRSSHTITLTSYINQGIAESVYSLDHFTEVDEEIGIKETGSFSQVSKGTYIALCSDKTIRMWDGGAWSRDLADDKIESIINKSNENPFGEKSASVGQYYDGVYYLWLNLDETTVVDSGVTIFVPDRCFRYTIKKSEGHGWTEYTGENMVLPYSNGVFIADDFTVLKESNISFLFLVDRIDKKIYWIESFDGPTGHTIGPNTFPIKKYFRDKYTSIDDGYDIKCRIRTKEMTGSMESFNVIHQESHAYMRDLLDSETNDLSGYPAITYDPLKVDARAFVNGKLISNDTAGQVNPGDDISFSYRVEGDRISIEFESNRSGHQIRSLDHKLRVQDIKRPTRSVSNSVANTLQSEFQSNLKMWVGTRPAPLQERTGLTKVSSNGITTVIGPDLRTNAVNFSITDGDTNPFTKQNTTIFNAFTFSSWIKTPVLINLATTSLVKINGNGASSLTLTLNSSNVISSLEFGGSVNIEDPSTATNHVNGWSQIVFVRDANASTMRVYQNNTLKGTLPVNAVFGGGSIEIGGLV